MAPRPRLAPVSSFPSAARWARSLPTVATVIELINDSYPVDASDATLVRSFNNDVFQIQARDRKYALKLYGVGRFTADEVRWEQQLARHLVDAGVPVAGDVHLRTGDSVGTLDTPEGQRLFALTEWLPGDKPQPPWDDALYRAVGSTLAQLHQATDSFSSAYPRFAVRTGDEPAHVIAALEDRPSERQLVARTADVARHELDRLGRHGLRWGITHGDPSLDNIHVSGDGSLYFYDLDLAGPGWQVEDLTGALSTEFADPFLDGYQLVRPLPSADLDALPWLRMLGTIDNLKFHLIDKPAALGTSTLSEGWVDRGLASLAEAARDAGLDVAPDPRPGR